MKKILLPLFCEIGGAVRPMLLVHVLASIVMLTTSTTGAEVLQEDLVLIGAGFGRTGTASTKAALELLGLEQRLVEEHAVVNTSNM